MIRSLPTRLALFFGLAFVPACAADVGDVADLEAIDAASAELVVSGNYAVAARNSDGVQQFFGPGRHYALSGHLGVVGNDRTTAFRLPPASRLFYCDSEGGPTGSGVAPCHTMYNYDDSWSGWRSVTSSLAGRVSYIELTPVALAYSDTDYRGRMEVLDYGEHRAIAGDFATVGNDQTDSLYIPPGVRVRVCNDEGGTTGHGVGDCIAYDQPMPDTTRFGISYAEVLRVATIFRDASFRGVASSHEPGSWLASDGAFEIIGDNQAESIIVPHGLTATVCPDLTTTSECTTFTRSQATLGGLANRVSRFSVSPYYNGSTPLTVTLRFQEGRTGVVTSLPDGYRCTSGSCTAGFHSRSTVRLEASLSPGTEVDWTGCSRTFGSHCWVDMMSARSVQATFSPVDPDDDSSCENLCVHSCGGDDGCLSECLDRCLGL